MPLHVELVSPEDIVFTGTATMVVARTGDGEIAFQPGHVPFVGVLSGKGPVKIHSENGTVLNVAVHSGFVEVSNDNVTILSDVEYPTPDEPLPQAIELACDADLLVHDAMHADHDYEQRRGWGHSPARAGVTVAEIAGAKKLALFHHSPDATDEMIDELVERTAARTSVPVFAAAEGKYLDV